MGFAKTESPEVTYIATTNELNTEETVDVVLINWLPRRKWDLKCLALTQAQGSSSECGEYLRKSQVAPSPAETRTRSAARKGTTGMLQESTRESSEHSQDSLSKGTTEKMNVLPHTGKSPAGSNESVDSSQNPPKEQWCDICEVVESDFLISPFDIYPNRKVQLEDADIKDYETSLWRMV